MAMWKSLLVLYGGFSARVTIATELIGPVDTGIKTRYLCVRASSHSAVEILSLDRYVVD